MRKILYSVFGIILVTVISSCGGSTKKEEPKSETVKIGQQEWTTSNLNVDKFRNGDLIPEAKSGDEWAKAITEGKPAWCYCENNPENGTKYGKLYNWFAIVDPRGLAPTGWHIPTMNEWKSLLTIAGPDYMAGIALKSKTGWGKVKENEQLNFLGFYALPGGYRVSSGAFIDTDINALFWSVTDDHGLQTISVKNNGSIYCGPVNLGSGVSVRCVKD